MMAMVESPFSNGHNFLKVGSATGPRISTVNSRLLVFWGLYILLRGLYVIYQRVVVIFQGSF